MAQQQSFLAQEKKRQAKAKNNRDLFSSAAQPDGPYSSPSEKHPEPPFYPFCLPLHAASENLYLGVAYARKDSLRARLVRSASVLELETRRI